MGTCDAVKNATSCDKEGARLNNNPFMTPKIINDNNATFYKFDSNKRNLLGKSPLSLEFTFSKIKVKHCISHSPTKNSSYITEISIGTKNFGPITSQGKTPYIDESFCANINKEFTLKELENTYLNINIYEFTEELDPRYFNHMNVLPEEIKRKSKYNSSFTIDLLSFLFKPKKCDFKMMGTNQLSQNTRISFICDIKHREKVKISVKAGKKFSKLIFQTKSFEQNGTHGVFNDTFSLETTPITMRELQLGDLYLETDEKIMPYYYLSLNDLKFTIIKNVGETILKEGKKNIEINSSDPLRINRDLNLNNLNTKEHLSRSANPGFFEFFDNSNSPEITRMDANKGEIKLTLKNMPIIAQISSLYFTEIDILYNTSILNMINDDKELNNYRHANQISCHFFYMRLSKVYEQLNRGSSNLSVLFEEISDILRRSIDSEKYYFLYPNVENLYKMIVILMSIGIKLIDNYAQKINDEEGLISLIKIINNIVKREELDNGVLYYCINNYKKEENNLINIYNAFYLDLFKLNEIIKVRRIPNANIPLIDLYMKIYFKKKYIRQALFNTVFSKEINYTKPEIDIFLYDITNDEKINCRLDQNKIRQYVCKKGIFSNLFKEGNYIFRNIITNSLIMDINEYPFDFSLFADNQNILNLIGNNIKNRKIENVDQDVFEISALLSGSYESINRINNNLIRYTNGYNSAAVFKLFDYFKSLFDYYYSKEQFKLIMDYSLFEKAVHALINLDNSVALSKVFWFYYSCAHLVLSGNLKYFISLCNINFAKFAYHWGFNVRQFFFRLILYILNDRLKDKEGRMFIQDNMVDLNRNNMIKKLYYDESLKDFINISKEYKEWKEYKDDNKTYPVFFLPLQGSNID